jgi:hypothetical protein
LEDELSVSEPVYIAIFYRNLVLQTEDKQLLKEVGKGGEGSPEEIHRLIDEVSFPPLPFIIV